MPAVHAVGQSAVKPVDAENLPAVQCVHAWELAVAE